MKKYKLICKKGEGTFSEVVKAENVENGKEYAIKCMKSTFDSLQQVNISSKRFVGGLDCFEFDFFVFV